MTSTKRTALETGFFFASHLRPRLILLAATGWRVRIRIILIPCLVYAGCLLTGAARAQSSVEVRLGSEAPGGAIPGDFIGLSFETSNLLPDTEGKYFFSAENKPLITLFKTISIRNLRVGGATAEMPRYQVPGPRDIDNLFAFANAAEAKVTYILRLGYSGNLVAGMGQEAKELLE